MLVVTVWPTSNVSFCDVSVSRAVVCLEVEHVSSTCLLEPPGSNNTVLSTGFSQSWPAPAHMSCLADSRAHTAGHWRDGEQRRVSHGHTQTSVNSLSDLSQYSERPQSIVNTLSDLTSRPRPTVSPRRVSSRCVWLELWVFTTTLIHILTVLSKASHCPRSLCYLHISFHFKIFYLWFLKHFLCLYHL